MEVMWKEERKEAQALLLLTRRDTGLGANERKMHDGDIRTGSERRH
jgi:hypothetical protein